MQKTARLVVTLLVFLCFDGTFVKQSSALQLSSSSQLQSTKAAIVTGREGIFAGIWMFLFVLQLIISILAGGTDDPDENATRIWVCYGITIAVFTITWLLTLAEQRYVITILIVVTMIIFIVMVELKRGQGSRRYRATMTMAFGTVLSSLQFFLGVFRYASKLIKAHRAHKYKQSLDIESQTVATGNEKDFTDIFTVQT